MNHRAATTAVALTLVAGSLSLSSLSRADDATVVTPAPVVVVQRAPTGETVTPHPESTGPDMRAIGAGLFTFGVSYGSAVVVAATSTHQGDGHLFVPIVGPWLDFGDRGGCPQSGACDKETTNRVLLIVDGVFQALGVLSVVSGFLLQQSREDTTTTRTGTTMAPGVRIAPVGYGNGGVGLAALGRF